MSDALLKIETSTDKEDAVDSIVSGLSTEFGISSSEMGEVKEIAGEYANHAQNLGMDPSDLLSKMKDPDFLRALSGKMSKRKAERLKK